MQTTFFLFAFSNQLHHLCLEKERIPNGHLKEEGRAGHELSRAERAL